MIIAPSDNTECPRHMCITGPLFSTKETASHDGDDSNNKITIGMFSREMGYDKMLVCEAMIQAGEIPEYNSSIFNKWYDYDDILDTIARSNIPFNYISVSKLADEYHINSDAVVAAIKELPEVERYIFRTYTYINPDKMYIVLKKIFDTRKANNEAKRKHQETFRHLRKLEVPKKPKPDAARTARETDRAAALNAGLYSRQTGAEYLGIPEETFRNYMSMNMIQGKMVGRYRYFSREALDKLALELKGYSALAASTRIGIGRKKIREMMDNGTLPYHYIGTTKRIVISYDAVEEQRRIQLARFTTAPIAH